MNPESKIGYDRIKAQVAALCTTDGGREKFLDESFSSDAATVSSRLRLADQMRQILTMESGFPNGEYTDITLAIKKAGVEGSFLEVGEIAQLKEALDTVLELIRFFAARSEETYPDLKRLTEDINGFPEISNRIETIIDRYGAVRDNASAELASIRQSIRGLEGKASRQLNRILAQAQSEGIVDPEATISIRDGRAVIPVAAVNKRKINGFIHDESASGRTYYIEPVEVVEINNELRELEYAERREIIRILTEFTEWIRPDLDAIAYSGNYVTTIDMIRAKARFAIANGCVMPLVSDEGVLELRQARHPLLAQTLAKEKKEVVPLDLTLTPKKHILIISGPNAGGKSVVLKTVGLLQWMFQSGMPIPALENSQLPLFDNIFIDIGDEQSIDNDLSTYSSHLLNMKDMLRESTARSLVLIDEFGTGTEPVLGGAIAEAILEKLESKGCYGVITTHYSNLKYYAGKSDGTVNGAMAFDVQNIRPLFRLEMGKPGSSFAIEIARKIGLPEDIIRSASDKAGNEHVNIEKQLREIARDKRYWEQKRDRIRIADRKVEELEQRYAEQLASIKEQRAAIIKQAKAEAEKITAEANRQIENAIKVIRESQADKELTRLARKEIDDFREALATEREDPEAQARIEREMERIAERQKRRAERQRTPKEKPAEQTPPPMLPEKGCKVRMDGQIVVGEVQNIKGKKAQVAFGQILTTVPLDKLTVVSNSEFRNQVRSKTATINVSADVSQRKLNFRQNIDVRGMRAAEALETVEDFIDDAIMVGATDLRILHGKGTGALKEEIRRYLRSLDVVVTAEDEHVEQGGAGITVVKLSL